MSVNLSWLIEPFFADPVMQPTSIVVACPPSHGFETSCAHGGHSPL